MANDTTTRTKAPLLGAGTGQELFLGLMWLGTSMWVAHATITGSADDVAGALGSAAAALPGVVAAMLVASASIASAAGSRYSTAVGRLFMGVLVGAVFGAIAAAAIRFGYGDTPSIMVLAITVGVAGVLGGAAAALPSSVLDAALWATSWVFFAGVIFGVLQQQITTLLGGGPNADPAAQATADLRFTYGQSILTGLLAGVSVMRTPGADRPTRRFAYVVAGLLPGVVLIVTEELTRLGGQTLVHFVNGFSPDEPALVQLTDAARMRHALIVLAVGGLVAAYKAARLPKEDDESDSDSDSDD